MQAAEHGLARSRMIILNKGVSYTRFVSVSLGGETLEQKTSIIPVAFGLDYLQLMDFR
jgi:hypothetical protein